MVEETLPIKFIHIENNRALDHFVQNSFIHSQLRQKHMQQLEKPLRAIVATNNMRNIQISAKYLVGVDKIDPNVFYSYIAYAIFEESLYIYFAYVKKDFRGFGFFKRALEILKMRANKYYYVSPVKIKNKSLFEDFEQRIF